MRRKPCYFKKFDLIIYLLIISIFSFGINYALSLEVKKGNKVEIYVNNDLKYVYPLQKNKKTYFINTDLGGVDVEFIDMKVRVTSSNSPLKICVKQGFISKSGQTIIGIPDKLLLKITGESEEELDGIAR
ncbi:MAG: NusG domain II-containing protein [Fusobacterium sp. JB021]|nr:NusG domain II-containing protein [Fusobacterium sp. JB021]MDP0505705.1 NusG domain II-containing protein [Fusobacterium sp. JB019]